MRTSGVCFSGLLLLLGVMPAAAENYALLIGAGKYQVCQRIARPDGSCSLTLEGPRYDVAALKSVLVERFHYSENRITVLLDEKATRQGILDGIDTIGKAIKQGDHILIYYSGHGTSNLDGSGGFGMDPATGAVVPTDLPLDQSKDKILASLIVGKRDLRPRFTEMEKKATVLVIFDSCFSGESVKSLGGREQAVPRFIDLGAFINPGARTATRALSDAPATRATTPVSDYPYQRVVYLSAAANNEPAMDLGSRLVPSLRVKTFHNEAHGAFTNMLLTKLSEDDSASNCTKLMSGIRKGLVDFNAANSLHGQTPQILFSDAAAADHICVDDARGITTEPAPAPSAGTNEIRAALDQLAAEATAKLNCRADKASYHNGEKTVLTCDLPEDGHVSVFSYGVGDEKALVLLPNKYDEGLVKAGKIQIPANGRGNTRPWNIVNGLPKGANQQEQVMLVLFSADPLDTKGLVPAQMFAELPESKLPSVRSQYVSAGYSAVEIVFPIVQ